MKQTTFISGANDTNLKEVKIGKLYVNKRGEVIVVIRKAFKGNKIYFYFLKNPNAEMWLQKTDFTQLYNECENDGCLQN